MNLVKVITAAISAILAYTFILNQPVLATAPSKQAQLKHPESMRIEVYSLSQIYWDTKDGDTLGEIVQQLLPYNKSMQQRLMQNIVELNPNAFRDNDPNTLRANLRLWLPNNMAKADTRVDLTHFSVQSFSWGNIKRPRR